MPEITNNTVLNIESTIPKDDDRETMIKVENVGMTFNMASEQLNSLKEYAIALFKKNLFFKELRALDNISFEIKKGDVYGILGTNGSGKSTLLKIVAGVLEPTDGKVTINGSIAPLIELGAGFDMELTARENIYLNGALMGYTKDFINEHFNDIVEFAEIDKFLDMPMKNYSSGMVARIAFAIATVIVPEILIVDEVLSVGDFMFQKKCEDRIQKLIKDHGTTVLIVSHSIEQIERMCNKAIWIEKGKTRINGLAEDVCSIYSLIGGRTGTIEAENTIIAAYKQTRFVNIGDAEKISYDSQNHNGCTTCIDLTERANGDNEPIDAVVLSSTEEHIYSALGNSIAGALQCPQISYGSKELEQELILWLEKRRPRQIYILDRINGESSKRLKDINFSWSPKIIALTADLSVSPLKWCLDTIDKVSNQNISLDDSIILTNYSDNILSTIGLCELSYSDAIPVIAYHPSLDNISDLIDWLSNKKFNIILTNLNLDDGILDNIKNVCKDHSNISTLDKKQYIGANKMLIVPREPSLFPSFASAGYYCLKTEYKIKVVDNTDLDSIAMTCNSLRKENIQELTFIQGENKLTPYITNMFRKIVASNKNNVN